MAARILIIEDDPHVVLFLSTLLQDHGFQTLSASNGLEGWQMIDREHPDLVLLDLMMPHKSGISLFSDMKKHEEYKDIPVIMVTGISGETGIELESFLTRGANKTPGTVPFRPDGYIEKPIDPDRLIALIKEVLESLWKR